MSLYIPEIISEKPEERSGHVCVCFRDNVIIWGGFNDSFDDLGNFFVNEYLPSQYLWIFNVSTCIWKRVVCNGEIPQPLSGACAACVEQTIYLFGGHCESHGHCNNLYLFSLMTNTWNELSGLVKGQAPLPRDKFGCWVFENRIIYFGGYGPSPVRQHRGNFVLHENFRGWNGQVAVLQIHTDGSLEWQYPSVKGKPPRPRAAHGMATIGNKGYLFGGRHSVCRDNDLHSFDLEKYEWSGRLRTRGPEPCGRSWHIFVACGTDHILLYGGLDANSKELEDAWLLDVDHLTWIEIDAFNRLSSPSTRLWHTACQTRNEGEVAIFGGSYNSPFASPTEHTNDLIFFQFSPQKLQRLCEEAIVKNKKLLPHRLFAMLPRQMSRTLTTRLRIFETNADR